MHQKIDLSPTQRPYLDLGNTWVRAAIASMQKLEFKPQLYLDKDYRWNYLMASGSIHIEVSEIDDFAEELVEDINRGGRNGK